MQRSTPISQLPSMQMPSQPSVYINDPQRQVQCSTNVEVQEDMTAVQEALTALGAPTSQEPRIIEEPNKHEEERFIYDPDIEQLLEQSRQATQFQEVDMKSKLIQDILAWNSDLKIALFAAGIFVILSSLPIERYIYRYIPLYKIPNSNLLIKTILMFICVLIMSKFI